MAVFGSSAAQPLAERSFGERFRDQPFAPWLLGSDQNEKFNSEMRGT